MKKRQKKKKKMKLCYLRSKNWKTNLYLKTLLISEIYKNI